MQKTNIWFSFFEVTMFGSLMKWSHLYYYTNSYSVEIAVLRLVGKQKVAIIVTRSYYSVTEDGSADVTTVPNNSYNF